MKNPKRHRWFCALGLALLSLLATAQAAGTEQTADTVEGTYWTDIDKLCVPLPTFKVVRKGNKLVGYERWSSTSWEEIPARQLQDIELKKLLAGRSSEGVSVVQLQEPRDELFIFNTPKGWRYNEQFSTETGHFVTVVLGPVDLYKKDVPDDAAHVPWIVHGCTPRRPDSDEPDSDNTATGTQP